MRDYSEFLASKLKSVEPSGITVPASEIHPRLFPFQRDLVLWALKRGRAALFCDTGLGKTIQQLEWARLVVKHGGVRRALILAPLSVAAQTAREAATIDLPVTLCREPGDVRDGINITNYDRLHKFNAADFGAVVLDESGCIKHHETKTLAYLLTAFASTPYKLCASATPAPNDHTELGTHAEFLNVRSRVEMLAEFFVHDSGGSANVGGWRLKGHARASFWEWVSSWAAMVRRPSDIGYDDSGYVLPPLIVEHHVLPADQKQVFASGELFAKAAAGLSEQRASKRASLGNRVAACAAKVAGADQWAIWCELNDEQDALEDAIGDDAVSIYGSLNADEKEQRYEAWRSGAGRVLITKPSIFGYGINAQFCHRMAFVGATNSFESHYQTVRRMWRFGQKSPVEVHMFLSETERGILDNLKHKEAEAARMGVELSAFTRDAVMANVTGRYRRKNEYNAPAVSWPAWMGVES